MKATDKVLSPAEATQRLLTVRQYQAAGQRAPHKPLLILLALGRLSQTGTSELSWSEAEQELGELLVEYGPPSNSSPAKSAAYPFTRLRSDGFWTLSRDVREDMLKDLRQAPVTGRLDPAIEVALSSSPGALIGAAVRVALQQFPTSLLGEILDDVGIDFEPSSLDLTGFEPESRRKRRSSWRIAILQAWNRSCAFCGFDGMVGRAVVGIEAAHVRWFNLGGPDELDNGLALCSLHHKLLDRGVIGFADRDRLKVSARFTANSTVGRRVYELHGHALAPRPGTKLPSAEHVAWHSDQVFLRPAI